MMDIQQGQEWLLDMINNLLIEVLATMAEQERLKIKLRQAEGIVAAKEKGKHLGKPNINFPPNWLEIYTITAVKAMEELNLKKNTFYKLVKQHEGFR
ncbi:DNA-invertase [Clostridium chromiireducens]|uniref:DNA-invertase n=1 Tax=Clostridium chromiireducens TaxID=225345 RepID=A0A1V4IJB5_9CLOT|nr:DNA-invertase [Clostridium chromiireducens]